MRDLDCDSSSTMCMYNDCTGVSVPLTDQYEYVRDHQCELRLESTTDVCDETRMYYCGMYMKLVFISSDVCMWEQYDVQMRLVAYVLEPVCNLFLFI